MPEFIHAATFAAAGEIGGFSVLFAGFVPTLASA